MLQYYKDFCKIIRKTTVAVKYKNLNVYCGPEYIQQVIDGSVKVDEEFRQVLLMNFSIFATAKDSSQ